MTPLFNKPTSMRVVRLQIQETGTYNQQVSRPYVADIDHHTLNAVSDRVNQAIEKAENITPLTLQGLGNAIVQPSPDSLGVIQIVNGWDTQRLRFILEVECEYVSGGRSRFYYTGYTSHVGITHMNQGLDPKMEFVINSVVRTRLTNSYSPAGQIVSENMVASKHVICDPNWLGAISPQQTYMMRPEDIINYKSVSHILPGLGANTVDARHLVQSNAATSSTNNGLAHNYAASIINSHVKSFTAAGNSATDAQVLGEARKLVPESMENPLLTALATIRGSGVMSNIFTIGELINIDPNTDNVTIFTPLEAADLQRVHQTGQTENWDGSDQHTVAATVLAQSVPSIMSGLMIRAISFTSTNSNITGQIHTTVNNSVDFDRQNVAARVQAFIMRLETEVLYDMCFGNGIQYFVDVYADLLGDIRITIGLDGKHPQPYAYPLFCNAMLAPVLTNQLTVATNTSENFSHLMDHVQQMASDIPTTLVDTSYV